MSTTTQPIPTVQIVPDSPSGTLPSTRSESDWQSLHSPYQQTSPSLILDASSTLISQCKPADLPVLLDQLSKLAIPIRGIDALPEQSRSSGFESKLGMARVASDMPFGTKVITRGSNLGAGSGELHAQCLRQSLADSLVRTRRRKAMWLIAQRPDYSVALGEVTGGFEALVNEGLCDNWGVREFRTRQLRDLLMTCRRRGYVGPKIYQGEYNLLWRRTVEARMPLIREHGMSFHAYEPFAKGALSTIPNSSRPSSQSSAWKSQYDTHEMQHAIQQMSSVATKYDTTLQSAGLRWLAYHSKLGQTDCIIVSASSFEDLEEKVNAIAKGPLPIEMVGVLDRVGEDLRDGRPVTPE